MYINHIVCATVHKANIINIKFAGILLYVIECFPFWVLSFYNCELLYYIFAYVLYGFKTNSIEICMSARNVLFVFCMIYVLLSKTVNLYNTTENHAILRKSTEWNKKNTINCFHILYFSCTVRQKWSIVIIFVSHKSVFEIKYTLKKLNLLQSLQKKKSYWSRSRWFFRHHDLFLFALFFKILNNNHEVCKWWRTIFVMCVLLQPTDLHFIWPIYEYKKATTKNKSINSTKSIHYTIYRTEVNINVCVWCIRIRAHTLPYKHYHWLKPFNISLFISSSFLGCSLSARIPFAHVSSIFVFV